MNPSKNMKPASMTRAPISVIVPVKNEEANIRACLESVSWCDQIFVVDSQSQDRTPEIAAELGGEVYQFKYGSGFPKKKNWALAHLPFKHDWVLLIDADERVTPELKGEIIEVLKDPKDVDGFYINRRLIFLGRWIRHCGWYPSWNMRLFKHRLGRFEHFSGNYPNTGDVEVHEHVVLQGKAGFLKHDLLHDDFKSIFHFIERHNRYSTWDAHRYDDMRNGRDMGPEIGTSFFENPLTRKRVIKKLWIWLPFRPLLRFLWMYVLRLGFLDGKPGLIFCQLMSFHEATISAKLYELKMNRER